MKALNALLMLTTAAACGASQASTCYEVIDPGNAVVYRSPASPIDLTMTISQGLAAAGMAGMHLVISEGPCAELDPASRAPAARPDAAQVEAVLTRLVERIGAETPAAERYDTMPDLRGSYRHALRGDHHTIFTGRRGGRYYVTGEGAKVYVRRPWR